MPAVTKASTKPHTPIGHIVEVEELWAIAEALNAAGWRATGFMANGACIIKGYQGSEPFSPEELARHPMEKADHLGIILPPPVIALDVDHKDGRQAGWRDLEECEASYGPLPAGPRQSTRSGGAHLPFRLPLDINEKTLRAHVVLPNLSKASIDILRPTHRYVRVYDPAMWIDLTRDKLPELPAQWLRGLVKAPTTFRGAQIASGPDQRTPTFLELCADIRSAEEGHRNSTLFANAARAFTLGYTDPASLDSLRSAAHRTGLDHPEVERTLESAWSRVENEWKPIGNWLTSVERSLEGLTKARRRRLRSAALEVAARCLAHPPDTWLAISSRDMAEALGVSVQVGAGCLSWLHEHQLLRVRDGARKFDAREYRIAPKLDTSSLSSSDPVSSFGARCGFSGLTGSRSAVLLRHPAFQRMGGELSHLPTLPGSSAEILACLEDGPTSARELVERTGYARQTVAKAIKVLDSACLVDVRQQVIWPLFQGSCIHALDQWAAFHRLDTRPAERKRRHRHQRFEFGQHELMARGVPLQGSNGKLVRVSPKVEGGKRVRRDVVVVVEWRGPYPVAARLETPS